MILSGYNFKHAVIATWRIVLLVLTGVGLSGCFFIPTPSVVGYSEIPNKTIESFVPGRTTRADVLLKLGEPGNRLENDRIFVYQWQQVAGFGMVTTALGGTITNNHYLGLEFGPENRLKRIKEFSANWRNPPPSTNRSLAQWMNEKADSPYQ